VKYYATVEGQTYEISIEGDTVLIDSERVDADMQRIGRLDLYSLLLDHASHEVYVEPDADSQQGRYCVFLSGVRYAVRVQDERSRRLSLADRSLKAPVGELAVRAPIPGLVVKVAVEAGQTVGEGDTLVILEAMKMENELRAARAGTVHEVRVQGGDQVTLGQVLLSLR
jgi:pyruvate carboxylase subunit B